MPNKLSSRFLNKSNINPNKNDIKQPETNVPQEISKPKKEVTKKEVFELPENVKNDYMKSLEQKILNIPIWFEYTKEQQAELIQTFVTNKIKDDSLLIPDKNKNELIKNLTDSFSTFGPIQHLIDNEKVESITINGTKSIYISIDNQILNTETNLSDNQLQYIINAIKQATKIKEFDGINKLTIDKYIVTIISESIANSGINIKIDKIHQFNKNYFIDNKILTEKIFEFILSLVKLRKNIVISGDINTFKTKFADIILSEINTKRIYLIEKNPQIKSDFNTLCKFYTNTEKMGFEDLISEIHGQKPEYLVSDLNTVNTNLLQKNGSIITLRSRTAENALKSIIGSYINDGLPEKFARTRALEEIDYIIHFEKIDSDKIVLSTILELRPAKTIQASIKTVAKFVNGKYVTDFSQKITTLREKGLKVPA